MHVNTNINKYLTYMTYIPQINLCLTAPPIYILAYDHTHQNVYLIYMSYIPQIRHVSLFNSATEIDTDM